MLRVKKVFMKLPLFITLSQVLSVLTWSKSWRAQALDFWPASFWPAETSCRWSADATTRPHCQPDRHDAGHLRSGPVLLQRQADDGEGPSGARALTQAWPGDGITEAECGHFLLSSLFNPQPSGRGGFYGLFLGGDNLLSAFWCDILLFQQYALVTCSNTVLSSKNLEKHDENYEQWCLFFFKGKLTAYETYFVLKNQEQRDVNEVVSVTL